MSKHDLSLDKNSPVPLYYQLKKIYELRIAKGTLKPHDKIPTEAEICEYFNVSRSTVRQALSELVFENKLYRIKSKGTFVSPAAFRTDLSRMYQSFIEDGDDRVVTPQLKLISANIINAFPAVAKALCLDPGTPVIHLKRNQLINDVIISYIDSFIVYINAEQLARICSQAEKSSIHLILEKDEETAVDDIVRHLSAISANTSDAKALGIKPGDPVLQMRGEGYSRKDGTPVIVERAVYTAYQNELSYAFKFDPSAP